MAHLKDKLDQLEKALKSWKIALKKPASDIVRDASIQRYEFTFELLWKTLKLYLKEMEGIASASPKSCFREARNTLKLTEKEVEACLQMTEDRNLSVHMYSENMAKTLYKKLNRYFKISQKIYEKIKADS